jgi:hypothetical protein
MLYCTPSLLKIPPCQTDQQSSRHIHIQTRDYYCKVYDTDVNITPGNKYKFIYGGRNMGTLTTTQCIVQVAIGRCPNITCMGLGICYEHLRTIANLALLPTSLQDDTTKQPHVFYGLFAHDPDEKATSSDTIVFCPGDYIASFIGERLSLSVMNKRYRRQKEVAPYAFGMVDGALSRGVGCCANTNKDRTRINAWIHSPADKAMFPILQATRTIYHGQEIFTDYGQDYYAADSIHKSHSTVRLI